MSITGLDQITGLEFWYKFDQGSYHDDPGTTLCTNGQTIHHEHDFSGNGRNILQPTDGVAMKYSSSGIASKGTTIEDLSTNRSFAALAYTRPSIMTLIAIQKINHFYATGALYCLTAFGGTGNLLRLMARGNDAMSSDYPPSIIDAVNGEKLVTVQVAETDTGLVSGTDQPRLVMYEVDSAAGGSRKCWYQDVLVINTTGASAISGGSTLTVGSNQNSNQYYFGKIGEIGCWNRKLTDNEHNQAVQYMVNRWSIAGITPGPITDTSYPRYYGKLRRHGSLLLYDPPQLIAA